MSVSYLFQFFRFAGGCVGRWSAVGLLGTVMMVAASLAHAQGYGGRTASVETAPAKQEVLSRFTDVQGRMVAGNSSAITAVTNGVVDLATLRIGDMVEQGQLIATQDSKTLRRQLALFEIRVADAKIRLAEATQADRDDTDRQQRQRENLHLRLAEANARIDELEADLRHEADQLAVNERQLELLEGKAKRAQDLADRNTLPSEAAETALGASLNARQQMLAREATITGKTAQLANARSAVARTRLEIDQLERDIAAPDGFTIARIEAEIRQFEVDIKDLRADIRDTNLVAPRDGQLVFLAELQQGYSREGDVIARVLAMDEFEVEAEIPVAHMGFVGAADNIRSFDLEGQMMMLKPRAVLPVQNARTGTQTVRFRIMGDLAPAARADNAVIVLKVPTSSPAPVVTVLKDAVLPVVGGHIVYVAEEGIAIKKRIRLGEAFGDSFVVLQGLEAGAEVIVRGNEALNDGKKIKIGGAPAGKKPSGPGGEAWSLNWTTSRGPASADLLLGTEKSLFNDEEISVVRAGDSINFIGKLFLPFGVLDLDFNGTIEGNNMAGKVTLRGLPGGREPTLDFTGTKDSGTKDSGTKDPGTKDSGTKDAD